MGDLIKYIGEAIAKLFDELLYYIGIFFAKMVSIAYDIFRVFSGTEKVTYQGTNEYLINVFMSNKAINAIYGGIALIGVAMCIGFTIAAVIKKMSDVDDKMHTSLGGILRKMFTSIVTIFLIQFVLTASIKFANTLMSSIEYMFVNANTLAEPTSIKFDEDIYASMARICDTIGNYSLNDSASSRYNLNACYNEIRPDMLHLEDRGFFYFTYDEQDENGDKILSVPYMLSQIGRARSLSEPMQLNNYDVSVSAAMLEAMDYLTKNADNIYTMTEYQKEATYFTSDSMDLGVVMFLAATTDAAKNTAYNGDTSSYSDPIRSPYVTGKKSIYSLGDVEKDFDLSIGVFGHFLLIIGCIILIREFLMLIFDCVARLFNLMLLYLAAPPFIASSPLDEGAKFKQWTIAFVVQCFNIFGTVIALRLFMLFCPMIFNSDLVILNGGFAGTVAKFLLIIGAVYGARKGSGIISGILADSAGWQSVNAGEVSSSVRRGVLGRLFERGKARVSNGIGGLAYQGTTKAAGAVLKAPFQAPAAIYGRTKQMAADERRRDFNNKMDALRRDNPEEALARARDFLGMNKEDAKDAFGMNDKQYDKARKDLSRYVVDRTWGGNAAGAGAKGNGGQGDTLQSLLQQAGAAPDGRLVGDDVGPVPGLGAPDMGIQPEAPGMAIPPEAPGMAIPPEAPGMAVQPDNPVNVNEIGAGWEVLENGGRGVDREGLRNRERSIVNQPGLRGFQQQHGRGRNMYVQGNNGNRNVPRNN